MREPENSWEVSYVISYFTKEAITDDWSLAALSSRLDKDRKIELKTWFIEKSPKGWIKEHISL